MQKLFIIIILIISFSTVREKEWSTSSDSSQLTKSLAIDETGPLVMLQIEGTHQQWLTHVIFTEGDAIAKELLLATLNTTAMKIKVVINEKSYTNTANKNYVVANNLRSKTTHILKHPLFDCAVTTEITPWLLI